MKQISFSEVEFEGKKRTTRREVFLSEMEKVTPWVEVLEVIAPHYPKGKRGRPCYVPPYSRLFLPTYSGVRQRESPTL
jgi:IS5 family transposase